VKIKVEKGLIISGNKSLSASQADLVAQANSFCHAELFVSKYTGKVLFLNEDLKILVKQHSNINGYNAEEKKRIQSMWLSDGITCFDCVHYRRCSTIFGTAANDVDCQFHPNRYIAKLGENHD